ncbi:hypothetical protein SAMN05216262_101431 [Colwellia chukchiensis]|uniref:Uncharacterized protein n=1 Tax=Colwellia chukchiensis TaxID=641665 RepID=A0A1H7H9B6_9GAMM|nr:hypothetical protein [Colwellia chukchiensis]SEK46851.1 hypothetical protein SAMN05216262_101431 [Colwellia chukchiensis]
MFKKTLLAASIAAMSTGAFAVNVASTALEHSNEGVQTAATIAAAAATATLKAEYKQDDLITFTFSQDLDAAFVAATTINATLVGAGGGDEMVLGKLSQDANSVTYRVTSLSLGNGATTTVGATVAIEAVTFPGAALRAAGTATVTYSATLSNGTTPLDQATGGDTATATIVDLVDQYATSVTTGFDGVIDVEDNRETFEGAASADTVTVALVNTAAADINATLNTVTYTVNGNFAFLDTDPVTAGVQLGTNTVTVDFGTVDSVEADKIVVSHNAAVAVTLTIDNVEAGVLPTQTFSVDAVVNYDDNDAATHDSAVASHAAGEWTINGSEVTFPYAPVGYDHIVTQFEIANSGNQDGDIILTAFDTAGNTYSATLPQKAEAGKLTKIGFDDVTTAFGLTAGTKLSLTITTTAPAGDIKITGYSNLNDAGRMSLLSDAYEGM